MPADHNFRFASDHPYAVASRRADLPADAFTRSMPLTISQKQRLTVDAIVMCSDLVCKGYIGMVEAAMDECREIRFDGGDITGGANLSFAHFAWSIIDQCYLLRKLIHFVGFKGDKVDGFLRATDGVPSLRNRMDHLSEKLPNIARAKSASKGLFGCVSYFYQNPDNDAEFAINCHYPEPLRKGQELARTHFPETVYVPFGCFRLSANDIDVDFDHVVLTLGDLMPALNTHVGATMTKAIKAHATAQNVPEEPLFEHLGGGMRVVLVAQIGRFDDQDSTE